MAEWAADQAIRRLVIKTYAANEGALRFWGRLGFRPRVVQMTALAEDVVGPPP